MDQLLSGFVALLVGAVLTVVLPRNSLRVAVSLLSQALGTLLILWAVIPVLMGGEPLVGVLSWSYPVERIDVHVDALGAFFLSFSLPLTFLGTLYAAGYLAHDVGGDRHVGLHFALLSLVQISYVIVYTVQNAFAFLVGWEIAALAAWLLVIWDHRDQKIRFAGFNYLVSTHLGLLFLVAAIMVMHGTTQSFQFTDFEGFLRQAGVRRNIAFVLLMSAFQLKSAFFPAHAWSPRVDAAAPAHVAALMSGVIHKLGLFGMLKCILMIGRPEPWMGWYLLIISAVSALMGAVYTISQRDLKRLLGYSSTENVGIAGMGFGLGCLGLAVDRPVLVALGFGGGLLHVVNHALFKCLLFYGAGAIYRFAHTVDLERLGGLVKPMRWTGPLFLCGCLASAALPPFNGFVSELMLYLGLLQAAPELGLGPRPFLPVLAVLALIGGLSALSIARMYGTCFLGTPRDPRHVLPAAREHPCVVAPMAALLVAIMAIGLCPALGLALVEHPVGMFLARMPTQAGTFTAHVPVGSLHAVARLSAICLGVVLALLVARRLARGAKVRRHVTWGCGYGTPNTRMQYTAASFAAPMAHTLGDVLPHASREDLPRGLFPRDGHYHTHHYDPVERWLFRVLAAGEAVAARVLRHVPEESRASFAAGLVALLILVALVTRS